MGNIAAKIEEEGRVEVTEKNNYTNGEYLLYMEFLHEIDKPKEDIMHFHDFMFLFIGLGRKLRGQGGLTCLNTGWRISGPMIRFTFEIPMTKKEVKEIIDKTHEIEIYFYEKDYSFQTKFQLKLKLEHFYEEGEANSTNEHHKSLNLKLNHGTCKLDKEMKCIEFEFNYAMLGTYMYDYLRFNKIGMADNFLANLKFMDKMVLPLESYYNTAIGIINENLTFLIKEKNDKQKVQYINRGFLDLLEKLYTLSLKFDKEKEFIDYSILIDDYLMDDLFPFNYDNLYQILKFNDLVKPLENHFKSIILNLARGTFSKKEYDFRELVFTIFKNKEHKQKLLDLLIGKNDCDSNSNALSTSNNNTDFLKKIVTIDDPKTCLTKFCIYFPEVRRLIFENKNVFYNRIHDLLKIEEKVFNFMFDGNNDMYDILFNLLIKLTSTYSEQHQFVWTVYDFWWELDNKIERVYYLDIDEKFCNISFQIKVNNLIYEKLEELVEVVEQKVIDEFLNEYLIKLFVRVYDESYSIKKVNILLCKKFKFKLHNKLEILSKQERIKDFFDNNFEEFITLLFYGYFRIYTDIICAHLRNPEYMEKFNDLVTEQFIYEAFSSDYPYRDITQILLELYSLPKVSHIINDNFEKLEQISKSKYVKDFFSKLREKKENKK